MDEQRIKEAFDQIRPDDEARLRMLNGILAASGQTSGQAGSTSAPASVPSPEPAPSSELAPAPASTPSPSPVPAPVPALVPVPAPARKAQRRPLLLRLALPLACSLTILATIGLLAQPSLSSNLAAPAGGSAGVSSAHPGEVADSTLSPGPSEVEMAPAPESAPEYAPEPAPADKDDAASNATAEPALTMPATVAESPVFDVPAPSSKSTENDPSLSSVIALIIPMITLVLVVIWLLRERQKKRPQKKIDKKKK
ncbi:MAG: hypothetical protein LBP24_00915 [Coriobacteriales bacterium]|jgi:hypothetical protein|nr:hypothetical protein [Coriobacteriales bacterium]